MKCKSCNKTIDSRDSFCPKCGAYVPPTNSYRINSVDSHYASHSYDSSTYRCEGESVAEGRIKDAVSEFSEKTRSLFDTVSESAKNSRKEGSGKNSMQRAVKYRRFSNANKSRQSQTSANSGSAYTQSPQYRQSTPPPTGTPYSSSPAYNAPSAVPTVATGNNGSGYTGTYTGTTPQASTQNKKQPIRTGIFVFILMIFILPIISTLLSTVSDIAKSNDMILDDDYFKNKYGDTISFDNTYVIASPYVEITETDDGSIDTISFAVSPTEQEGDFELFPELEGKGTANISGWLYDITYCENTVTIFNDYSNPLEYGSDYLLENIELYYVNGDEQYTFSENTLLSLSKNESIIIQPPYYFEYNENSIYDYSDEADYYSVNPLDGDTGEAVFYSVNPLDGD